MNHRPCPHGQDRLICKTCVSARDYWAKFDWAAYYKKYRPNK